MSDHQTTPAKVDISRQRCESFAAQYSDARYRALGHGDTATLILALRAALDAAEAEGYKSGFVDGYGDGEAARDRQD